MLQLVQGSFIFRETTSAHFFRVTTATISTTSIMTSTDSLEQLLFYGATFSQLFFQNSVSFRAKLLQSSLFLRKGSYLGQLIFGTAIFFWGGIVQNKDIYRRATFSKQVLLHSIYFFRKATFWKKLILQKSNTPYHQLFLESCLFRAATFSKDATFYSMYLFRRAAFLQLTFSKELIIHSHAFVPQLYFLFICQ